MKLFFEFLRTKRQAILCFFVCTAMFFGSFWLYGFPMEAVVYPAVLCLIVCAIFLIAGFIRVRRRHAELSSLMREPVSLPDELPQALGVEARDYQRILTLLAKRLVEEFNERFIATLKRDKKKRDEDNHDNLKRDDKKHNKRGEKHE